MSDQLTPLFAAYLNLAQLNVLNLLNDIARRAGVKMTEEAVATPISRGKDSELWQPITTATAVATPISRA